MRKKVLIMGAAGRDFHNFNLLFRNNKNYEVVAFTAAQIPDIEGRVYPAELAGELYPNGIPIFDEEGLRTLVKERQIDEVIFSYSDVSHSYVMERGCQALASGADYRLVSPESTMLKSKKPVISICAVRTGSGKSQTTRKVRDILNQFGKKTVVVRHPMPYGDLSKQRVQRFASLDDLDKNDCSFEEREEYEHHITSGSVVFAGVDYEAILRQAEKEADVILWDGGNNDTPFFKSDLEIVVMDPHRPGHELSYFPGMVNFLRADVLVINKMDSAQQESVATLEKNIKRYNPQALVIKANSTISVDNAEVIKGKKVLVVEDGPTLTHGDMKYGAGVIGALRFGAAEIVDPKPYVKGKIAETFETYPNIGKLLPCMGYSDEQIADLQACINATPCDGVVIGTPIDLSKIIQITKPNCRVFYSLAEIGSPNLKEILEKFVHNHQK
jgi:predicted GTPase